MHFDEVSRNEINIVPTKAIEKFKYASYSHFFQHTLH